jgi:hypothetical protein
VVDHLLFVGREGRLFEERELVRVDPEQTLSPFLAADWTVE